jgi:hypothetical protein
MLLILRVSDIFHCICIHNKKRAWVNTCTGVLGADAVEVEMEEWGEGQEEVEVLDEVMCHSLGC